jgi:hypothetical protein
MIDGEQGYEKIRKDTNLEKLNPEKLVSNWNEVIGQGAKVGREKFVNIGGELNISERSVLSGTKLRVVDKDVFLSWKNDEGKPSYLKFDENDFMAVQNHDSGERSIIITHSSVDKISGKNKQTTRRFTAVKE